MASMKSLIYSMRRGIFRASEVMILTLMNIILGIKSLICKVCCGIFRLCKIMILALGIMVALWLCLFMIQECRLRVKSLDIGLPNELRLMAYRNLSKDFILINKSGDRITNLAVREITWNENYIGGYSKNYSKSDLGTDGSIGGDIYFIYKVGLQKAVEGTGHTKQEYYDLLKESGLDVKNRNQYLRFRELVSKLNPYSWYDVFISVILYCIFQAIKIVYAIVYMSAGALLYSITHTSTS